MQNMRFLWKHTAQKKQLLFLLLLVLAGGLCSVLFSFSMGSAVQMASLMELNSAIQMTMFIAIFGVAKALWQWAANIYGEKFCLRIELSYHDMILKSVMQSDFAQMKKHKSGDLMSRIQNSLARIPTIFDMLVNLLSCGVVMLVTLVALWMIDWHVLIAFMAVMPLCIWVQKKMLDSSMLFQPYIEEYTKLNALVLDVLGNRTTVKTYRLIPYFMKKVDFALCRVRKTFLHAIYTVLGYGSLSEIIEALASIVVTLVTVSITLAVDAPAGSVISALLISQLACTQLGNMTEASMNLPSHLAFVDVVREVLEMPQRPQGSCTDANPHMPPLSMVDVRFRYEKEEADGIDLPYALDGVSFTIKEGAHVAVVGESGSGKSTVVKLLAGLYKPNEGAVMAYGTSVQQWDAKALPRHMATVPQAPFLFATTIGENIRCVKPTATDEDVLKAADKACLTAFIQTLPEGMNTQVGEKGATLSGGQCQRIAIARAFLVNPAILVLDEATSALDSETEQTILAALSTEMAGKTMLSVAHRLTTVKNSDCILVMAKGKIVQAGTHNELLASEGVYEALWNTQQMEQKSE